MARRQAALDIITYPAEDGSVTESDKHYTQGATLVLALKLFFADRPDVFVGGNIAMFYEEGNVKKYFGPDVLVAFGVQPGRERPSYFIWEEGVTPQVIIELTSESTRDVDVDEKPPVYARLGVREYYLFDPRGDYLKPRLQGYHLNAAGEYERLWRQEFDSPALGLRLMERTGQLRLFNPATGTFLPTPAEQQAALAAQQTAITAAEAEVARLRAELVRLQAPPEPQ